MKKLLAILSVLLLASMDLSANFERSFVQSHPLYPGDGPFILELSGTWPTDCHPGEQKPVIKSFDGQTLVIEFEIVLVHVTCNNTDTDYRSLVDLSEIVRGNMQFAETIDVKIDFLGIILEQTLDLACPLESECPDSTENLKLPERGLYVTPGRASEGLLVARQNSTTVIYPLVYDETGKAEWLFSAGHIVGDSFFAATYRWSGGDCFDCDPTDSMADRTSIGHLSVLVDRPGFMQVKVNERAFSGYQKLVYGYNAFPPKLPGAPWLIGLEGRWALSENHGTDPPLGDLSNFIPPAFDMTLEDKVSSSGQVSYLVTSITGDELGQLVCTGATSQDGSTNVCDFIDPTDQAEPLLLFYQDGPSSISIKYGRAVIAVGIAPGGKAVRLD